MSRNIWLLLAAIILALVFLSIPFSARFIGLGNTNINPQVKLEVFLKENKANTEIAEAYRFALENPQEVLSKVRCYCGCLKQDHRNNRDCFINEDGSFDSMGLNCGLCVKTALLSKKMLSEGKTIDQISDYVDSTWGIIN